ncbi:hypothetical protein J4476_01045 [Candidatus Woesearchaeota archaeon]|nr:hypothetical protein [Candidatus Woesearchaeota archaeon]HIH25681.1 hypothetical protein [Nanoarchaeota archaeon]
MEKACIYSVESLSGGEVGIERYLSQCGYIIKDGIIYDKEMVIRGKIIDGVYLSNNLTLELHIFDNPNLEKLIDDYRVHNSHSEAQ